MNNAPFKLIRAQVIKDYVKAAGYDGVVAFSCGNATEALRMIGLRVLDISPHGDLAPTEKWWSPAEIHAAFPRLFDATSGHLPAWMMYQIGQQFKIYLGSNPDPDIPTGSGETILCLRWAYPEIKFNPVYNLGKGSQWNKNAPLNGAVLGDQFITPVSNTQPKAQ